MFTGIVQERGRVASFENGRLVVESSLQPAIGDSVSVDGVCLTVTGRENGRLEFDVMAETVRWAKPFGAEVNLEGALRAGDPLGGHFVTGHIDGIGTIIRYVVEKGSITIDGVSLTIAAVDDRGFAVAFIPHTLDVTTLGTLGPGDKVNLETDVLAKYVERLLRSDT